MKKKIDNLRFKLVRKGYDITEAEAYIKQEEDRTERIMAEQRERIITLSAELKKAEKRLNEFSEREEQIKSAIVSATEKADVMTADIRFRYGAELERLNLFRAKWTGAYQELSARYSFSKDALNLESVAVNTKLEIERFLSREFSVDKGEELTEPEKQFRSEAERLSAGESGVKDLKDKLSAAMSKKSPPAAAFSLEEAQNPTESLAQICNYLGLGSRK